MLDYNALQIAKKITKRQVLGFNGILFIQQDEFICGKMVNWIQLTSHCRVVIHQLSKTN